MPRMRKQTRDQIKKLIEEGYTNIEISEKLKISKSTVSNIRKEVKKPPKLETRESDYSISKESMQKLLRLQALLGTSTLDETINKMQEDHMRILKTQFEFDSDYRDSPGEVVENLANEIKKMKDQHFEEKIGTINFTINLTMNLPYSSRDPWTIMKNGVPHWDFPRMLGMVLGKDVTEIIIKKIEQAGINDMYDVRVDFFYGTPSVSLEKIQSSIAQERNSNILREYKLDKLFMEFPNGCQ